MRSGRAEQMEGLRPDSGVAGVGTDISRTFGASAASAVAPEDWTDMAENRNPFDAQGGIEPYSPFVVEERSAGSGKPLSLRGYTLALTGLVFVGFLVMGACASLFGDTRVLLLLLDHYLTVTIVSLVASIAGIVMMGRARSSQSVGLSLAGYALFVLSFGFTTSTILLMYSAQTISTAFLATAGLTATFACLGIAFPRAFAKIQGILGMSLLALIVVQVVMGLMGVSQTGIDLLVIVVFCGFIGYDFYRAMQDEPTLVNAVYNASNLFLDIINVFVRVLSIFGRRD